MALNQTNKLVWIVNTIRNHGRISFANLNDLWVEESDLSDGKDMLKRTFHKWLQNIRDTFGLDIECEKCGQYRYYIENSQELRTKSFERWLISTYSVSNSLAASKSIKDRIILEDVPSGMDYLDPIIDAMKQNRFIHITYYNYWRNDEREHYVMPLCVKLFRQRWYLVGREWPIEKDLVFCLDRICDLRPSSHTFDFPDDFLPQEYFEGCFGIIVDDETPVETVRLKVSTGQANYLRDLPLHESSQQEVECNNEYSIFQLRVRPTFDFQQEILWNGEDIEVLSPEWLRKEIAGKIKRMWNKYKEEKL